MLINWLLYPLLLLVASAGHGLLVRRAFLAPSGLLVLPVGFALMLAVTTLEMHTGLHGAAWIAPVVLTVAGLALGRRDLRRLREAEWPALLWPAAAALAAFATFAVPVVLTGRSTFTGFTMITDIANHFDLTARLIDAGHTPLGPIDSSYAESVRKLQGAGYPTGLHSLLGAWSTLLGRELAWMYQPTLAFVAPMAALSAFGVLRRAALPAPLLALGAAIVVQANLLFAYGLVAGFKELFASAMILAALAVLIEGVEHPPRMLLAAIPLLAGYDAFAGAIAPWMGVIVAVFAAVALLRSPRVARHVTPLRFAAGAAALGAIAWLVLPSIRSISSLSSNPGVQEVVTSQTDLGNLAAPLDPLTSAGIWLTGDYRFPLTANVDLTHGLAWLAIALAVLGTLSVVWRRRPETLALALAAGVPLLVVLPETGPWVDAKIFAITGTLVLALAFVGIGALAARRRLRLVAWPLAAAVAGGVLYGNALAVHDETPAPEQRLAELERIGHRFAGQGPALAPSFDEYAEYFLRQLRTVGRVNPPNGFPGEVPQFGADLDQVDYDFVKQFRLVVLRRNPATSRPPSDYRLVYRTRFYDVWRKLPRQPQVFSHVPLNGLPSRPEGTCRAIAERFAADPNAASVEWAVAPDYVAWDPTTVTFSPNWPPNPAGETLTTRGPGRAHGPVRLPRSGRYRLWQLGSFERPLQVKLDGRRIATLQDLSDYPSEAVLLGTLTLAAGRHQVEVRRGGGTLVPGNGDVTGSRIVGPLYFERLDGTGGTTFTTPVAATERVCRTLRRLDWVELLGPRPR